MAGTNKTIVPYLLFLSTLILFYCCDGIQAIRESKKNEKVLIKKIDSLKAEHERFSSDLEYLENEFAKTNVNDSICIDHLVDSIH